MRVAQLPQDPVPVPTQVARPHRQAAQVQQHAAVTGLGQFDP